MKEILKIDVTLYPVGCEIREEYLDTDRIVLLSNPKEWVKEETFEMDLIGEKIEDYREIVWKNAIDDLPDRQVEQIIYKYIVKNPFVTIDINTVWLGFQDNNERHSPCWSEIDYWQECTSYQETFEYNIEWVVEKFKAIIDEKIFKSNKLNPPYQYVALVEANCHTEVSTDWESGIQDADFVEITLNKIIEI